MYISERVGALLRTDNGVGACDDRNLSGSPAFDEISCNQRPTSSEPTHHWLLSGPRQSASFDPLRVADSSLSRAVEGDVGSGMERLRSGLSAAVDGFSAARRELRQVLHVRSAMYEELQVAERTILKISSNVQALSTESDLLARAQLPEQLARLGVTEADAVVRELAAARPADLGYSYGDGIVAGESEVAKSHCADRHRKHIQNGRSKRAHLYSQEQTDSDDDFLSSSSSDVGGRGGHSPIVEELLKQLRRLSELQSAQLEMLGSRCAQLERQLPLMHGCDTLEPVPFRLTQA